jgi:hypothetical protein
MVSDGKDQPDCCSHPLKEFSELIKLCRPPYGYYDSLARKFSASIAEAGNS